MSEPYAEQEPTREQVDALPGPTLIEFGASWCGHCQMAQPLLQRALAERPGLRHLKIEDAAGRRLGRSFRVKLWPTLVFFADGQEIARVVRPTSVAAITAALAQLPA